MAGEDLDGDWSCVGAASRTVPRVARDTQSQEKDMKQLEALEGAWPCQYLDFKFLASRSLRKYTSLVLSHSVCKTLL